MATAPIEDISRLGSGWRVKAGFSAIDRSLKSKSKDRIFYVFGEDVGEEHTAFSSRMSFISGVTKRWSNIDREMSRLYSGRLSIHRRVQAFFLSYGHRLSSYGARMVLTREQISEIESLDIEKLKATISKLYVETRRSRGDHERQINEYLEKLFSLTSAGPYLIYGNHGGVLTFERVALLVLRHRTQPSSPLVVLIEGLPPFAGLPRDARRRDYIGLNEFVASAAAALRISEQAVRSSIPFWRTILFGDAVKLLDEGCITADMAERVLEIVQSVPGETQEPSLASARALIPAQKPAPLIFEATPDGLGLTRKAIELKSAYAVGAARALFALAGDMHALTSVENIVPSFRPRVRRIETILGRMKDASLSTQADIIEFGIEISSLEACVEASKTDVGEISLREILSFLMEARLYLAKSSEWQDYTFQYGTSSVNEETAETARSILKGIAESDFNLTDEARERINEVCDDIHDRSGIATREGYSASAENLTAEVGKAILDEISSSAKDVYKGSKEELKKTLSKSVSQVFMQNAPKIYEFAAARGGKWIGVLMEIIQRHVQ